MVWTLIIAWLALQIPLCALIGMLLRRGMARPRRQGEGRAVLVRLMRRRLALEMVGEVRDRSGSRRAANKRNAKSAAGRARKTVA